MTKIYPVIMCGGSGTRLWPISVKAKPKQYHPITSHLTMLQETIERMQTQRVFSVEQPTIVCAVSHLEIIEDQFKELDCDAHKIILEPMGRNTAPVAAIVSEELGGNDNELILLLPADHHISDKDGFWQAIESGIASAKDGHLVTFGIAPTHPETGYGYIQAGASLRENCVEVEKFIEKPDLETAKSYLASKNYFWNAGIFLFSPNAMLAAFEAHAADILTCSKDTLFASDRKGNKIFLDQAMFKKCRNESIDYAIMEAAENVSMVCPVSIGWNDIGSWEAVKTFSQSDRDNTVEVGDVISIDCKNSYFRSDGPMVAAIGLENIIIVATDGAILVTKADKTQEVKNVVHQLKAQARRNSL